MKIKTVTTVGGINPVYFGDYSPRFYWFKNLSDSTLYVSSNPNMIVGGDDVAELPPKSSASIETTTGVVYVLGAGKVEIHNTDSKFCPFKGVILVSGGGGGGETTGYITDGLILFSEMSDTLLCNLISDEKIGRNVNSCDGTNGYFTTYNTNIVGQMSAEFSLQLLIRTTQTSSSQGNIFGVILDSDYKSAVFCIKNGYFGLERASGNIMTETLINDDEWHMLTAAYDGTAMRLYVDGVNVSEYEHTWSIPSNAVICVGQWYGTSRYKYVGNIANACIYNRALSDDEIAQNWQTDIRRYGISN